MTKASDLIRSITRTLEGVGATSEGVAAAFDRFVDVPERLTWPVMWCRDHDRLESAPGCLLNQARRSESD